MVFLNFTVDVMLDCCRKTKQNNYFHDENVKNPVRMRDHILLPHQLSAITRHHFLNFVLLYKNV